MTINLKLVAKAKELISIFFGGDEKVSQLLDDTTFAIATSTSHFDRKNTVYINARSLNDLSVYVHELLHRISTSNTFNKQYIGLHKKYIRKIDDDMSVETSLGYAINEGATEYYTLAVLNGKYPKAQGDTTYNFCSNIYKNLEGVLPGQVLKLVYANGNVDNFIKVISFNARTNQDNVLKLILSMDAYFDTNRVFNVFMLNPNSADAKQLLVNAYTYLAAILSDNAKAHGRTFNFWEDVHTDFLTKEELQIFAEVAKSVDISKIKQGTSASLKLYDRMAMHILTMQHQGTLRNFDLIPDNLRCGEFYNFLLLNTQLCDSNGISCDIKTKEIKSKLTQKIFNPKYDALSVDKYLPQNTKTILSTRYAVRSGAVTSDYYAIKSFPDADFRDYLQASWPDYYEALCDMTHDNIDEKEM